MTAALPEEPFGPIARTGNAEATGTRVLNRLPRVLLHAEGLAVAGAAIALYFHADYPWWLLLALILAPDLPMVGYLTGPKIGTATYNAAHTYSLPVILAAIGVTVDADIAIQLGLIWIAHIGIDRALGYGLKYPTGFKDTHLQRTVPLPGQGCDHRVEPFGGKPCSRKTSLTLRETASSVSS